MSYPDTPAQRWAEEHCNDPAFRDGLGSQTLAEWWHTSKQAHEMLWVARKADALPHAETSVRIALECAELVEHLMPDESKRCLELVRQWLEDPESVSGGDLHEAFRAAHEMRAAMAWAALQAAERAVLRAAERAAWVAWAAWAAGAAGAGWAEAEDVARAALRAGADPQALADVVRKHIPDCPINL